jgi:hypothetical protein
MSPFEIGLGIHFDERDAELAFDRQPAEQRDGGRA